MRKPGYPSIHWLVAVLVLILASAPVLAFVAKTANTEYTQKEFFRPDLYISTANAPMQEMTGRLVNQGAWNRFFQEVGLDAQAYLDPRSGTPSGITLHVPLIPGTGVGNTLKVEDVGGAFGQSVPKVDSDLVARVMKKFVEDHQEVLAVDVNQMGETRAVPVTDDLWNVSIPQQVNGIPVRYARIVATINHGNLVLLGTETWGNVRIDTTPVYGIEEALNTGLSYLAGKNVTTKITQDPHLEIIPYAPAQYQGAEGFAGPVGAGYGHRLSWVYRVIIPGQNPVWEIQVDAQTGELLAVQDTNDYATDKITGGVYPLTDTEICPDLQRCGTMQTSYPMPYADTGLAAPNNFTNTSGLFSWTSGTVTTALNGKYVKIIDTCGAVSESSVTGNLNLGGTNGQHDCTSSGTSAGDTPASRSAFYEVNKLKELARGWLPSNTWLQGQLQTTVNLNSTCNAYYSGGTINFYKSGGGCRNTGEIAAVFDHEWGHGLDYADSGASASNPSESYADITAILRLQMSCVGYGFWWTSDQGCGMTSDGTGYNGDNGQASAACETDCSGVRGVDWAKHVGGTPDTPANFSCVKCNSGGGPCGREVHCDAMPTSEAAWDLAARDLQAAPFSYDTNTAFATANKVFYQGSGNVGSWHACTCPSTSDGCGAANGYLQWLAADDDNGNISDGTPHMTAIYAAFNRHGIACQTPTPVNSGCQTRPTVAPILTVAPGSNALNLSWTAVPGATAYWVMRGEGFGGCNFSKARIATVGTTSYTDSDVANGTQYSYIIIPQGTTEACFGPASTCVQGTPQPCAGSITVTRTVLNCSDSQSVTLTDIDLAGSGTHNVNVFSGTEPYPGLVLALTETPANSGIFTGSFQTTSGAPGPGQVRVANGDTVTVRYVDASFCGTPNVQVDSTTPVDCAGPVISNVHSQNVTGITADVLWDTNEPANSTVVYDTVIPPVAGTTSKADFLTTRTVKVGGLYECTTYFYKVQSTDPAGNSAQDTNGGAYYTFTTGKNTNPTYDYAGAPVPIPDNSTAGAAAPIVVGDNKTISNVTVKVTDLQHTFDADITLHLIAPDATDIVLSAKRGSSGDNYTNTVFDDAATTPIASGTAPFTGSFKPDNPLSVLNGKNAAGTWTLFVVDSALVDSGVINSWSITFTYPAQACGAAAEYISSTTTDSCTVGGGGGNGYLDPGEDVVMPVTARNGGTMNLTGIVGHLTSSTPGVYITRAAATFPNLAVNATGSSAAPHFAYTLDSSIPCGSTIDFRIAFATDQGTFSSTFSKVTGAPANASVHLVSPDVPKPIADSTTVTSNLVVAQTATVQGVKVGVDIVHTWDGDLNLVLIGPNGTSVPLASRRGSLGHNFTGTIFDDAATTAIGSGSPPYTGSFKPESPLAALVGIPANGTWKMSVQDAASGDTGTLTAWYVDLTLSSAPTCTNCSVAAPAGEVTHVIWTSGSLQSMQWDPTAGASFYNVYRGVPADLPKLLTPSTDSCLRTTTGGTVSGSVFSEKPAAGSYYWYLVRAATGGGEGPAGDANPGGPRTQNSSGGCP